MKKIITIIAITLFISCSSNDEENVNIPEVFTGRYYYAKIKNCKNDYVEFDGLKGREVSFVIEAQAGGQNTCSNEIQGVDELQFTIINDSIITNGSGFLKIIKQGNDIYKFIDTINGSGLEDLIISDGSDPNTYTWYMKRTK